MPVALTGCCHVGWVGGEGVKSCQERVFYLWGVVKKKDIYFGNLEKRCTFAAQKKKRLEYGVMVTLQILVLSF